jgi:hypothetical protein
VETLYFNSYFNIFRHRAPHNTLELQWLDFVPSTDFRAAITELMRLAHLHQAKALIADNRHLRALRQADLQWSGDQVFNGLSKLGGQRFAVVESLDAMNRMGVNALVATLIPNTGLTSQYFSTVEEARTWATASF